MGLLHHVLVHMGDMHINSPSFSEFVYHGCWLFDNGAKSEFDDVLLEQGGLLHVLPLAVHLKFCWLDK